ncbi:putative heme peroxidase [Aquisphaera giovannonii]|uniref:Putative heme peroxidase n=1 Tax=Aquisphaera giovannonii TaxID=406548 RepID=A0A5B9WAE9_9BACT|nr:hydrogen peroxide-dependent heme synthase [Aquisphaera giovannonii]QEH37516.1 putative heme peroxidase [Aquisphaera giovannonii]
MSHETSNPAAPGAQAASGTPASPHGRRPGPSQQVAASLVPETGWHFLHLFYRVDRERLRGLTAEEREAGRRQLVAALGARQPGAVDQLQGFAVPGHKADFGVVLAGPDLKAVHGIQTAIQSSALGPAIVPTYSFYSLTEVSEYVPDAEEYGRILREREDADPESPSYKAKVAAYAERLGPMNRHRLYPDFPDWPCLCFYPMSKMRSGDQNWYLLPFEERSELMAQHGRSGMKFAGRVSQVITASTGIDDWEWGVTLWARNPSYLKEIVYTMRYDESSAKYALFGDFYFGYILPPEELLEAVKL